MIVSRRMPSVAFVHSFRFGSWLCENAAAGSLTGLDCGATKLGKVLEHILPIWSATQNRCRPYHRERWRHSQKGKSQGASRPDRRHNRLDAEYIQYTCQIVGEHMHRAYLGPLWTTDWFVYAKRPFAGPEQVLAYLSRHTHPVVLSHRRLISADPSASPSRITASRAPSGTRP